MTTGSFTQAQGARLILQHRAPLYGYIYACMRNHADAEDVFQDVTVAVLESIKQLRKESEFFVWAREIAFRRLMSHVRKNQKETPLNPHVIAAMAEATDRAEQSSPFSQEREILLECLEKLPQQSRDLVLLRYENSNQRLKEIARKEGLTTQAVYSKLKRIKEILRNCVSRNLLKETL